MSTVFRLPTMCEFCTFSINNEKCDSTRIKSYCNSCCIWTQADCLYLLNFIDYLKLRVITQPKCRTYTDKLTINVKKLSKRLTVFGLSIGSFIIASVIFSHCSIVTSSQFNSDLTALNENDSTVLRCKIFATETVFHLRISLFQLSFFISKVHSILLRFSNQFKPK